jgi:hypothetical protein
MMIWAPTASTIWSLPLSIVPSIHQTSTFCVLGLGCGRAWLSERLFHLHSLPFGPWGTQPGVEGFPTSKTLLQAVCSGSSCTKQSLPGGSPLQAEKSAVRLWFLQERCCLCFLTTLCSRCSPGRSAGETLPVCSRSVVGWQPARRVLCLADFLPAHQAGSAGVLEQAMQQLPCHPSYSLACTVLGVPDQTLPLLLCAHMQAPAADPARHSWTPRQHQQQLLQPSPARQWSSAGCCSR